MKKKYVAPASALLTLNFNENIAASSSIESGSDSLPGTVTILFTQASNGCRGLYTDRSTVTIGSDATWFAYFVELSRYDDDNLLYLCTR